VMRAIWQDHGVFGAGGWKVAWGKWGHDTPPLVSVGV
jgi:hypothetical protein